MLKSFTLLYSTELVRIVTRGKLKLNYIYVKTPFKYIYSMNEYQNKFIKNKSSMGVM